MREIFGYMCALMLLTTHGKVWNKKQTRNKTGNRRGNVEKKSEAFGLPQFSEILAEAEPDRSYQIEGCLLEITTTDCEIRFQPSGQSCSSGLTFETLLKHFFPEKDLKDSTYSFFIPEKFLVNNFVVGKCDGMVTFDGSSVESLEVIPRKLSVLQPNVSIGLNFRAGNLAWEKLSVRITGATDLGGPNVKITMAKKPEEANIKINVEVDQISVTEFTKLFTNIKPESMGDDGEEALEELQGSFDSNSFSALLPTFRLCQGRIANRRADVENGKSLSTGILTKLGIEQPKVRGVFNPLGSYEFAVSGLPKDSFFKGTVFVIIRKEKDKPFAVGVLASIENLSPTVLLTKLTGKDLSKLPLLGNVSLNFAASVANREITDVSDKELATTLKAFGSNYDSINQGVTMQIDLPVREIIQTIKPDSSDEEIPDSVDLKIKLADGKVNLDFPDAWKCDFTKILSIFTPKAKSLVPQPLQGGKDNKMNLEVLDFNYSEMVFKIGASAKGPIELNPVFKIFDIKVEVTHRYNDGEWEFSLTGSQKITEDLTMNVNIANKEGNFELVGGLDKITMSEVAEWLKLEVLKDFLLQKFDFLNIKIEDFKVKQQMNSDLLLLRITGKTVFADWPGVEVEAVYKEQEGETALSLGIQISKVRLDEVIESLFGKKVKFLTWLGELDLSVALATSDDNSNLTFTLPGLKDVNPEKGVKFQAQFTPPTNCEGEKFCEQAKSLIKTDKKILLEGMVGTSGFTFKAQVEGDWKIGSNVVVNDMALVVEAKIDAAVYFAVQVTLKDPNLVFTGQFGIGIKGNVELKATMKGMWEKPFGLKYLAVGDLQLVVGIYVGAALPALELAGRIHVGKIGNGREIKAEGAIGIDPLDPTKNYFYAKANKVTLKAIAEAFELSVNLPDVLLNSGFPEGLIVSFTLDPDGKEIESLDVKIPPGFAFQGTIRIDTYDVYCEINIRSLVDFEVRIELSPLNLAGGMLVVQRSSKDKNLGPLLYAKVSPDEFAVQIAGYVEVLGITAEANITINNDEYYFFVEGKLFNVIQANLTATAKGRSLKDSEYEIRVCISSSAKEQVEAEFEKIKKEQAQDLRAVRREAVRLLREVTRLQKSARKAKVAKRSEMLDCYIKMAKEAKLLTRYDNVSDDCTASCKRACLGSVTWKSACTRVEGMEIGCPSWTSCQVKSFNETCYADCKRMQILNRIKAGIRRGFFGDMAKKIKSAGDKVIKGAKWLGSKIKDGIQWTANQMQKVLSLIIEFNYACFGGSLSMVAQKACVNVDISVKILQIKTLSLKLNLCLDASFIRKMAEMVFGKAAGPIKESRKRMYDLRELVGKMTMQKEQLATAVRQGRFEDVHDIMDDFEDAADSTNAVETESFVNADKHFNIPYTEEDHKIMRYVLTERAYLLEMKEYAGYKVAALQQPMKTISSFSKMPLASTRNATALAAERREKIKNPCKEMSLSTKDYVDLAKQVNDLLSEFRNGRTKFEKEASMRQEELRKTESAIEKECKKLHCIKGEQEDMMHLVKTAKAGHKRWLQVVQSQLDSQNENAVDLWRRSVNESFLRRRGYGIEEHLQIIGNKTSNAMKSKKTDQKDKEREEESLNHVTKGFYTLLTSPKSLKIDEASAILREMEPHLLSMWTASRECHQESGLM